MTQPCTNDPTLITLKYRQGDLIIKEGDYGISIYKINKGRVLIFRERDDKQIALSTLMPGEIFGEIAFLRKAGERRSASARALEETELEVWHPSILSEEYVGMPPMLRYVVDQLVSRLLRMNHLLVKLSDQKNRRQKVTEKSDQFLSQRRYYRKTVDLECYYWPTGASPKVRLPGWITDLSLSGVGMKILPQNTSSFPHMPGDSFTLTTVLPNGRDIELRANIVSIKQDETSDRLTVGMSITDLSDQSKKLLGFFLMPG